MGRVYVRVGTSLVEPGIVEGPIDPSEVEAYATRGIVCVQDIDGGLDL